MMTVMGFLVFAAAFAGAMSVFAFTLVPALPRIAALLRGEGDPALFRQPALILSENRVRARIRSTPVLPARMPLRAAA
jgi:hypothetical protein